MTVLRLLPSLLLGALLWVIVGVGASVLVETARGLAELAA